MAVASALDPLFFKKTQRANGRGERVAHA